MYYSEIRTESRLERIANLQKSSEAHNRALKIFAQHGEIVSVTSRTMISKVEKDLYWEKRAQRIADVFLEHVTELPLSAQRWAADMPNMMASNIMDNPAVYGFATAPDWLSEIINAPPSDEDAKKLRVARDRLIDAATNDTGSDYTALLECRWQAAEIDLVLLPLKEAYHNWLALITTYAGDFTPEQYIRRGSRVIGMAQHAGERPPVDLLQNIADAFGKITVQRDRSRLETFLCNNPALMRFVACELCEHGQWDSAISVIENSRVLLHAEHAQESRDSDLASADHADPPYWVYVTHSPKGTYVILGPTDGEGSASGIFLPEINGAKL